VTAGKVASGDVFGTRAYLKNNYLYRMAGAVLGIYGNSKEEAMYPAYRADAAGQPLDGAKRYTLHFKAGELPPVHAFWSVTMYDLPASLLVDNPIRAIPHQFAHAPRSQARRRRRTHPLHPARFARP
jgi:hypothetical protein